MLPGRSGVTVGTTKNVEILNEAFAPGACVAEVARQHDVSTPLVYTWRRKPRDAGVEPEPDDLAAPGFSLGPEVEDEGV